MKKIIILITCLISALSTNAQPESAQKASDAIFTLTTFNKDGSIHASSHGVFISNDGEAISTWKPFYGATYAVVVNSKGEEMKVESLIGANELYDVCRFKIKGKTPTAPIAVKPAETGDKVWILKYSTKKAKGEQINIDKTEKFGDKYTYYIFNKANADINESCPIVNGNGEIIGLLQKSSTLNQGCATDANFIRYGLNETNGLSINDPLLSQSGIRIALPKDYNQATLMLMLASQQNDSVKYINYANDFIEKFPTATDGYIAKARIAANHDDFTKADEIMSLAINNASNKDIAHSEYAGLIYRKLIYNLDSTTIDKKRWTLSKALEEAQQAYEINPLPQYQHQKAQILFSQNDYQKAYDILNSLSKKDLHTNEIFYEAAQCKMQMKAPFEEIKNLLDSAVSACPKPLDRTAAPYILARGIAMDKVGKYRDALLDYIAYDTLMAGHAAPTFYYTRSQCETKLRRYEQAINDMAHAAVLNPQEPTYLAELASLQLRVGQFRDAIQTADICISRAPQYTDAYIIKGISQIQSKQKEDGLKTLTKAKELGDERAEQYINKYK